MLLLKVTSGLIAVNSSFSSQLKVLYNPRAFFTHAAGASGFPHCAIFPTAASRRSRAVSSPGVANHPLRPAKDRSLGEPLPHQQANLLDSSNNTRPEGPRFPP